MAYLKTQEKDTTYAVLEDLIFDADEDPEEFDLRKTSATTTDVAFKNMVVSMKKHGVVQPIIIHEITLEDGSTRFQVIAGRRRCRAAVAAGFKTILSVIDNGKNAREKAIIENIHRKDLTPIEEMRMLHVLKEIHKNYRNISAVIGKSMGWISDRFKLSKLDPEVQNQLDLGQISIGEALEIANEDSDKQKEKADQKAEDRNGAKHAPRLRTFEEIEEEYKSDALKLSFLKTLDKTEAAFQRGRKTALKWVLKK